MIPDKQLKKKKKKKTGTIKCNEMKQNLVKNLDTQVKKLEQWDLLL